MEDKNTKRKNLDGMSRKIKKNRKHQEPSTTQVASRNNTKVSYFLLFLIFLLALFLRFASFNNVFTGGNVIFPGYDPYYHMRLITYNVMNFPDFLWSDPYVNYPFGYNLGWMPLYDLVIAFFARLFSFGSPTIHTIETIGAIFPAVLGAITVLPVFFIGKELRDFKLGLLSAFLLAIMPAHLGISRVGITDHHVAEVFLFSLILLLLILSIKENKNVAGTSGQKEKLDNESSKKIWNIGSQYNLVFAALAGMFTGILVFTWSAAHIYIAIFSIFFIIQYGVNLYKGKPSDNLILTGAVTGSIALIITVLLYIFHWLPLYQVAGVVAFFCLATLPGILSNAMLKKKIHWLAYPVAMISIAILMVVFIRIFPQQFGLFDEAINYLTRENIVGSIAETQPFAADYFSFISTLYFSIPFGFALIFALIGLIYYMVSELGSEQVPEKLLFMVCALAIILLTLQQVRFSYLSAIFVAILAAYFIHRMIYEENFVYNTKTITSLAFLILLIGLPTAFQSYTAAKEQPAIAGDWWDSLIWLRDNTPVTSFYNDPGKNPEYSVMAWWDYGNWIEYVARRPVVSNNFQAGVDTAAQYFTADSEKMANDILDQRRTRYVIVDVEMGYIYKDVIYGKYGHVLQLANKNRSDYVYAFDVPTPNYNARINLLNNKYYNTIYARLYILDGSSIENPLKVRDDGLSHYRLVYESKTAGSNAIDVKRIKIFEYVPGAILKGVTSPHTGLEISVPVSTNVNRTFNYIRKTVSDASGNFSLAVPYATEGTSYETGPTGNYALLINGIVIKNISINEQQILNGSSVDLGYVDNPDKRSSIIQPASGKPGKMDVLWKYDIGKKIYDIKIRDNVIYASSEKEIYAIGLNTSSLAWKQELQARPTPLEIKEDMLFAAFQQSSLTKVYMRNLETDKISMINVPYSSASVSPVLVDGNDLYIGTGNILNAFDLSGKVLKWRFSADDAIVSKPASNENMIYAASFNGTVYALDKNDGTVKWEYDVKTKIWSSFILVNNTIYFGDRSGNINALDAQTGGSLWKYETGYFVDSAPVFLNGTLYASSNDGKVYALDASSGEPVWKSEQLFPIYASPVVEKGSIYVGALDGKMYKLNRTDGRTEGICATNGTITASPVARDGMVYVGSQDGNLSACRV